MKQFILRDTYVFCGPLDMPLDMIVEIFTLFSGAVDKYRLRRKFPLPATIWDGEETVYCFKVGLIA